MSVKATPGARPSGNITVTIETTLLAELRERARRNRRSISAQVAVYVDNGLERERVDEASASAGPQ